MKQTANMGLSIYEADDVTSYLITYNDTMETIDTYCGKLNSDLAEAKTDINTSEESIANINTEIVNITGEVQTNQQNIENLQANMTTARENIQQLQTDVNNLETTVQINANMAGQIYRGILSANETTIAISIGNLKDDTLIDVYTDHYGLQPVTITTRPATGGNPNMVVMTFEAQSTDVKIAVVTRNTETITATYDIKDGE